MTKAVQILCLAVVATICLATSAFSQTQVTLTGPPPGYVYDGIYMSPYYATVGSSTNVPVICDDFGDNSWPNSTWSATTTSFSSINGSNTSWGVAGANTSLYGAVGYMVGQVLNATPGSQQQIIDSFLLWAILDPKDVETYLAGTPNGGTGALSTATLCSEIFGACTAAAAANPGGLLGALESQNLSASSFSNLVVLSPDNGSALCAAGQDNCAAQEFIYVSVAEGGTALAYLLLAGLCCFGAMYMKSRRQVAL